MVDKRAFPEDAGHDDLDAQLYRPRRRLSLQDAVISGLMNNDLPSKLEPTIRRVVKEELEKIFHSLHSSPRTSLNQPGSCLGRGLRFRFIGKVKEPSYTGSKIETEGKRPVRVVLVDAISGEPVTCGPLSAIKVEIVPLVGHFNSDEKEIWTKREFIKGIARERAGRRPLLAGDLVITLRNGEADINNLIFTDNSSWLRSRKFRLGAKAPNEETIGGAMSEAFTVKDQRGESYKKHSPPRASDEVWRLKKISKDGRYHKRLANREIHTVGHFLQLYASDPILLRHIITGGASRANKIWDKIIEHATTCVVDDAKLYQYTVLGIKLFLNSVYRVVGATFDGKIYLSPENFSPHQKDIVEKLKPQAYKNIANLYLLEDTDAVAISKLLMNQQPEPSIIPSIDGHATHPSTSYAFQGETIDQLVGSSIGQSSTSIQEFSFTPRNSLRMPDDVENFIENSWSLSSLHALAFPSERSTPDVLPQTLTSVWPPNDATWSQGMLYSTNAAEVGDLPFLSSFDFHFALTDRARRGWFKIWAAVKCGISLRKDIAAKKKQAPLPLLLQA